MVRTLILCVLTLGTFLGVRHARAEPEEPRELTVVPFLGGDSDVGWGGGFLGSFAELDPDLEPYLYRIEAATTVTLKGSGGRLIIPYIDSFASLDLPHGVVPGLRVRLRVSYTREATLKYYGLGNAARIPEGADPTDSYYEHERTHPTLRATAEYQLPYAFHATWGIEYTHNWVVIPENTRLREDMLTGSATVRKLLRDGRRHGVVEFSYGLGWDTRDNEVHPRSGQYHTLTLDLSPGGTAGLPHRFARLNASARFHYTLVPRHAIIAVRGVFDGLFGEPPFYELPRYADTSAIGGIRGVRGIPAQRYYGRIKAFSNTELRSELFDFDLLNRKNTFAVAAFFDAGRVWSDFGDTAELDGTELGLRYGVGGGLRILAGRSFVLRLDLAWSREARPLAAYLASGHVF